MKRSIPFAAALASAAALTLPQAAGATTFCVDSKPCEAAGGMPKPTLENALQFAGFLSPGQDRIELGAGTFSNPDGWSYLVQQAGEGVDIVGAGPGKTKLVGGQAPHPTTLVLNGHPDSSVSDLTVVAPDGSVADPAVALHLSGSAKNIEITGSHDGTYEALTLDNGSSVARASIQGADYQDAVGGSLSDVSITDTTIHTGGEALFKNTPGTLNISRTRIDARSGAWLINGDLNIDDSVVVTHGGPALQVQVGKVTVDASHDTLAGDGTPGVPAIVAGKGPAPSSAHYVIDSSIIAGYASTLTANPDGGLADVKLRYSSYPPDISALPGQVDESLGNLHVAPGFADASFRLSPYSPLVDAGNPDAASGTDLDGAKRALDGNGDGSAVPDIGAYESPAVPLKPKSPDPATPPAQTPPAQTPPAADNGAPSIKSLKFAKRRFKVVLSKDARVKITIRQWKGRALGTLTRSLHGGKNTIAFKGRVGKRVLTHGRYVAVAVAKDAAGHRSKKRSVTLRW